MRKCKTCCCNANTNTHFLYKHIIASSNVNAYIISMLIKMFKLSIHYFLSYMSLSDSISSAVLSVFIVVMVMVCLALFIHFVNTLNIFLNISHR